MKLDITHDLSITKRKRIPHSSAVHKQRGKTNSKRPPTCLLLLTCGSREPRSVDLRDLKSRRKDRKDLERLKQSTDNHPPPPPSHTHTRKHTHFFLHQEIFIECLFLGMRTLTKDADRIPLSPPSPLQALDSSAQKGLKLQEWKSLIPSADNWE